MKTYEDFVLSKKLKTYLESRKASKFVRDYYKLNGSYPSASEISTHSSLTNDELEAAKQVAYSNYVSITTVKLDFDRPEQTVNTPEQDEIASGVVETLLSGTKNVVVDSINNLTIPSEVNVLANITGNVENGATFKSESSKAFTINNTSENPVDIQIETNSTVYLTGKYDDIYLDGKNISASSGKYAEISGEVTIDPSINENVSITANFVGSEAGVNYAGDKKLTISNANGNETTCLGVYAPNATVEMGGKYDTVEANVSDDTLILKSGFHARNLKVNEGKIMYYGVDIKDFVDRPLDENVVATPYTLEVNSANISKVTSNSGVYRFVEDVTYANKAITFGLFANGRYRYDLNGHTLTCGNASTGCMYVRGSAIVDFVGNGKLVNNIGSYGIWIDGVTVEANIYSGEFQAYTHVLYAYRGTINIYGGTFKILGEGSLDKNGHEKFLLNCYDANYLNGTAKINVYGGKFYNFNPAEAYGEPGSPVSYVAEGYHVVESIDNGIPVFEVVKD